MSDWTLHTGDCLEILPTLEAGSVDSVITDPPYGLGFMGKEWDTFAETPNEKRWNKRERNLACEIDGKGRTGVTFAAPNPRCEKCGKVRRGHPDRVCTCPDFTPAPRENRQAQRFQEWCGDWAAACYRVMKPSGYLLAFGGTRTWHRQACALEDAGWELRDTLCWLQGQGLVKAKSCLKPCWEPILLARKPGPCVLPLNADAALLPTGRRPANVSLNEEAARLLDEQTGRLHAPVSNGPGSVVNCYGDGWAERQGRRPSYADSGGPSRFYYVAKASRCERGEGNGHPALKPLALMRWLVRLVTQPGEVVLDPFVGSGTTLLATLLEGRRAIGIEKDPGYAETARKRLAGAQGPLFAHAEGGTP